MAWFLLRLGALCSLAAHVLAGAANVNTSSLLTFPTKPRVFVLSDISNEPDDQQSLTRYLLYANQFQTEGLVAVTSTWLRDTVYPEDMLHVINAYGKVTGNLNKHAPPDAQYPPAEYFRSVLRKGSETYGMTALAPNATLSPGAKLLIQRLQSNSSQPLWILAWGGTNVLAQALQHIHSTYSSGRATELRSKLRVYAISDQDDTGAWIRTNYPDIFYISSTHGWNQYGLASWIAISGETYYGVEAGAANTTTVSKPWLRENIQIGPYGSVAYPDYKYIMEGDTPTFLYLIQNGLGDSENPGYGSWGGRYSKVNYDYGHWSDAADRVVGLNNATFKSNYASIWRWREAFQLDFAARMQWSLPSSNLSARVNHHPVVAVNGNQSLAPLRITAETGSTVTLDTTGTYDPDNDDLTYRWFQYEEPGSDDWNVAGQVPALELRTFEDGKQVRFDIPNAETSCNGKGENPSGCWLLHVILEVRDRGAIPLTTYRRVLVQTTNGTMTE